MKSGQSKYRLLIESLSDGFAYHRIMTDSDGFPVDYIFLDVNSAFEKITGLKLKRSYGKVKPLSNLSWIISPSALL